MDGRQLYSSCVAAGAASVDMVSGPADPKRCWTNYHMAMEIWLQRAILRYRHNIVMQVTNNADAYA